MFLFLFRRHQSDLYVDGHLCGPRPLVLSRPGQVRSPLPSPLPIVPCPLIRTHKRPHPLILSPLVRHEYETPYMVLIASLIACGFAILSLPLTGWVGAAMVFFLSMAECPGFSVRIKA